jgi:hypothetical protein
VVIEMLRVSGLATVSGLIRQALWNHALHLEVDVTADVFVARGRRPAAGEPS